VSDTKQFVFEETLRNVHPQYGPGYVVLHGTDNVSHTASGPGGPWTTAYGSGGGRDGQNTSFRKTLSNSSGNSETVAIPWGDGFQNLLTTKNGLPSTKCRIDVSSNGIINNYFVGNGPAGSIPITYDISITEENSSGVDQTTTYSLSDQISGNWYLPGEIRQFQLRTDHHIQGSNVTGGAKNTLSSLSTTFRAGSYNTPGYYSGWDMGYTPYVALDATRSWEGNLYTIDGVGSDTIDTGTVTSTMTVIGGIKQVAGSSTASQSTLNEQSKNLKFFAPLSVTVTSTVSIAGNVIVGIDETLTNDTTLLASTANLKLGDANLTATTTVSTLPTFRPGVDDNFTSAVTAAFQGNLIFDVNSEYTWDSFNLNSYFVQGFTVDNFSQSQGEYSWTFLSTDSWDDWTTSTWIGDESTWDNWPKDVWEEPYGLETAGSMIITPAFKLGDVVTYNSAFTIVEGTALEEAAEADLASQFTTDFTAVGIIDVTVAISSAMSPSLTANIIYDLNDSSITITGAFSPVLTANAITDTFADIDVAFTFAVEPTFKPAGFSTITTASTFEQLVPTFKPAGFSAMVASAGTLTVGRLFFPADPYQIAHVSRELRKVVLPIENRQTLVMSENRLNTITQETSDYLVPQETRNLKLRIAPFKNRFSTPRVRQEQ